jgi:nucleoside-diphosphate-sugar epimerase
MRKTILITGCGGFIASHLVNYFAGKNYKIYAQYRHKISKLVLKKKNIIKLKSNILSINTLPIKCDAIIHCAYQINIKHGNNFQSYKKNLHMFKMLLKYSLRKNISKFFFMSSISVYGKIDSDSLKENARINNPNLYGKSKLMCEKLLYDNKKIRSFIFRLPGVVGKGCHDIFLSNVNNKIKNNKKIYAYNLDSKFNNIVHVNDLSKFIFRLFNNNNLKKCNYIFNLASKYPLKIKKLINILFRINKKIFNLYKVENNKKAFIINFNYAKKFGYEAATVFKNVKRINSI